MIPLEDFADEDEDEDEDEDDGWLVLYSLLVLLSLLVNKQLTIKHYEMFSNR